MNTIIVFFVIFAILTLLLSNINTYNTKSYMSYIPNKPELAINTALIIPKEITVKQKKYPKNDLVDTIMKHPNQNVVFKTTYLNDVCKTSKDCPDGLLCVFNGSENHCAKEIPISKCQGLSCNSKQNQRQKYHKLGETCGIIPNSIVPDLCDDTSNLRCMSNDFRNNFYGICSKIIN